MNQALTKLVEDLKATYGANLGAVVVYGLAATGAAEAQKNINTLVTLKRITPAELRLAQPIISDWRKASNPLPLFFTEEELRTAEDVFPVEFGDIITAHRVIYGADPLAQHKINLTNLRHQLEYELRSRLIKLRELYIPNSADPDRLDQLMSDSLNSFALYFRHTLVLLGHKPALNKRELLDQTIKELALKPAPFAAILRVQAGERLPEAEAHQVFAEYLGELEKIIGIVDQY